MGLLIIKGPLLKRSHDFKKALAVSATDRAAPLPTGLPQTNAFSLRKGQGQCSSPLDP